MNEWVEIERNRIFVNHQMSAVIYCISMDFKLQYQYKTFIFEDTLRK